MFRHVGAGTATVMLFISFPSHAESVATVLSDSANGTTPLVPNATFEIRDIDYPLQALLADEEGDISLRLTVDERGRVMTATTIQSSGSDRLDQRTAEIARQRWAFQPSVNGQGTAVVTIGWRLPLTSADEYFVGFSGPNKDSITEAPQPLTQNTVSSADYPALSVRTGQQGEAYVAYEVKNDGNVGEMHVVGSSGFSRLDDAAMKVVSRWKFASAKKEGMSVEYWNVARINFTLGSARRFCANRPFVSAYDRRFPVKRDGSTLGGEAWVMLNEQKAVIDALLQTKRGWMHVSRSVAESMKLPPTFPPIANQSGKNACWIRVPE